MLVGESLQIGSIRRLIRKAAGNRFPVLLLGESGTGKEVVARAIYDAHPQGQFVPIDCGSLVGTLMESELFGHVRGAFSGATENKKGLVEMAAGGTAFFDEIGDLPLEMQVKLLRLIQEREFRPVGSLQWRKVDLRVMAATHRDLAAEVASGRFRLDLFYRLNVLPIHLPPLRDRKQDIPLLVEHFLKLGEESGIEPFELGPEIMDLLLSYDWPGNVRELKHCIDRMAALHSEGAIQLSDMPSALLNHRAARSLRQFSEAVGGAPEQEFLLAPKSPVIGVPERKGPAAATSVGSWWPISVPESEKQAITAALAATNGERGRAAEILRISRTTLYRRMKEYGFDDRTRRHVQYR